LNTAVTFSVTGTLTPTSISTSVPFDDSEALSNAVTSEFLSWNLYLNWPDTSTPLIASSKDAADEVVVNPATATAATKLNFAIFFHLFS